MRNMGFWCAKKFITLSRKFYRNGARTSLQAYLVWLLGFLALTAALWILGYVKKPSGLKLGPGYAIYSSAALNAFIDGLAHRASKLWKAWFTVGTVLFAISAASAIYLLGGGLIRELTAVRPQVTVMPVVPGLTIPLLPGVVALVVTVLVHEFSHAIAARNEGVKVNRLGVIFVMAFPVGAFTEPDEQSFKESTRGSKLRVLAAGSMANLAVAGITLGLMALLLKGYPGSPGALVIQGVIPGTLASRLGLETGYLIYGLNNTATGTLSALSAALAKSHPGQLVTIVTNHGNFTGALGVTPTAYGGGNKGFIGVELSSMPFFLPRAYMGLSTGKWLQIQTYAFWIWFINLNVGIFNALPIPLLDGDQFFKELIAALRDRGLPAGFGYGIALSLEAVAMGLLLANLIFSASTLL